MHTRLNFILKNRPWLIVSAIFLFALILRLWKLGSLPATFQEDEVLSGYVGRYILENGKDIYGNSWPLLYFNKFGDYYIIFPMYLAGISTYFFGVTEFAVRFPVALVGSLIVFPLYIFTKWIFKNAFVGYLSAFFVSITPWHLVLSRSMVEGILGSTIFLAGIVSLLYAVRNNKINYLLGAAILFLLTYLIYHPFRLYTPVIFLPLFILFPSIYKQKKLFLSLVISTVFFFALTIYISKTPWGSGRLEQTSIFSDLSGVTIRIQQSIFNTGEGHIWEARIFHNKVVGFGREFVKQYLTYFSPIFLFMQGSTDSRYDIPEQGLLFISYIVLIVSIFIHLSKNEQHDNKMLLYFFFLIVLAPIPAAFTYLGSPNIHRAIFLSVLFVIPIAYGFYNIFSSKYRFVAIIVLFAITAEFIYFWHQYSTQADIYTAMRRNDGYKELIAYVKENKQKYTKIYLPAEGNTALYYLFYTKDFSPAYAKKFGFDAHIDQVENIYFIKETCPSEKVLPEAKILIVNRHNCPDTSRYHQIERIRGVNELLGFKVLSP